MIAWPRTIQARLTLGYAVAFAVGLVVFAGISYASLDIGLKTLADDRLLRAERSVVDILSRGEDVAHAARERLDLVVGSSRSAAIFAAGGRAVYSNAANITPSMRAIVLRAADTPRLTTMRINGFDGRIVTQRAQIRGTAYHIGIWRQLDLVDGLERLAIAVLGTAVIVIGATAVLVGSIVAREGLRPLRAVAALASEIEAHDLSRRLDVQPDSSELGQLATTFDRMLARLENAFERQRRFTADASHELRAPLSVVHIAAELALRREREPAAYQRVLASILQATQQLEALTDNLLLAARADAGHVSIERVDLSALAVEALEQLASLAESKRVRSVEVLEPHAFVYADRSGIVRAVVALLDNAIKFSPERGSVFLSTVEERDVVRLILRDEGPGFSDEGLLRATDRFWRSDAARAPGTGSGLGLAISDSIVRASGGTLTLQNASGGGARVVLEFPAAR